MKAKLKMFKKAFDFLSKIIIKMKTFFLKSICSVCNNKKSRSINKNE